MGVEVVASEVPQMNGSHDKENGEADVSEPIKFGSHGVEEQQAKGEAKIVTKPNVPTNAADEWPDAPKIHSFWAVRYRSYEDPSLKAKIEQVDREIQKTNQRTSQINELLKPKRTEKAELKEKLRSLAAENSQYAAVVNEKRQEMKPLRDALGTLRGSGGAVGICSSEAELDENIRRLQFQIQHESMTLKEEKQIMKEIRNLELTRPQVAANSEKRAKIQDSMGKTEVIQDQVKLLGSDMDSVRKQRAAITAKMDQLGQQVKALDDQINPLRDEYSTLDAKRKQAFDTIRQLRTKRDEGNACFYQNRNILNGVRELAAKKDLKGLEELVETEVEKFMSQWNSNKAFRADYEKRILMSLDMRQLSRDGRIRNPGEKPLVMAEAPRSPPTEVAPKAAQKPQKEDPKPTAEPENTSVQKVEKETKKNEKESKTALDQADEEEIFMVEKPKKQHKENEIDEKKLKEIKREEEKEKQRQALERKKKQQEKAAAKAALRAQKEAEKKQKDRERKMKKKETTSLPTNEEESSEKEAEETEPLKSEEEAVETSVTTSKTKDLKDKGLRNRRSIKTRGTLPKTILKKKKSDKYWMWGSIAAAVAVVIVILLAVGYNYLM